METHLYVPVLKQVLVDTKNKALTPFVGGEKRKRGETRPHGSEADGERDDGGTQGPASFLPGPETEYSGSPSFCLQPQKEPQALSFKGFGQRAVAAWQ